jgi:FKBP-type peptidyl-prolyl cis-trans isomerase
MSGKPVWPVVLAGFLTTQRADGKLFDSTRPRERPLSFRIGEEQVIEGLEAAVRTISLGERAKATIPSFMAYGARGFPGRVPKNTDLLFDIELVNIQGAALPET